MKITKYASIGCLTAALSVAGPLNAAALDLQEPATLHLAVPSAVTITPTTVEFHGTATDTDTTNLGRQLVLAQVFIFQDRGDARVFVQQADMIQTILPTGWDLQVSLNRVEMGTGNFVFVFLVRDSGNKNSVLSSFFTLFNIPPPSVTFIPVPAATTTYPEYVELDTTRAPLAGPYLARLDPPPSLIVQRGTVLPVNVILTNLGAAWTSTGRFTIAYRIYQNGVITQEWLSQSQVIPLGTSDSIVLTQLSLGGDLNAGYVFTQPINFTAPSQPGTYEVQWDLVMNGLEWMSTLTPPALTPPSTTLTVT